MAANADAPHRCSSIHPHSRTPSDDELNTQGYRLEGQWKPRRLNDSSRTISPDNDRRRRQPTLPYRQRPSAQAHASTSAMASASAAAASYNGSSFHNSHNSYHHYYGEPGGHAGPVGQQQQQGVWVGPQQQQGGYVRPRQGGGQVVPYEGEPPRARTAGSRSRTEEGMVRREVVSLTGGQEDRSQHDGCGRGELQWLFAAASSMIPVAWMALMPAGTPATPPSVAFTIVLLSRCRLHRIALATRRGRYHHSCPDGRKHHRRHHASQQRLARPHAFDRRHHDPDVLVPEFRARPSDAAYAESGAALFAVPRRKDARETTSASRSRRLFLPTLLKALTMRRLPQRRGDAVQVDRGQHHRQRGRESSNGVFFIAYPHPSLRRSML